MSTRFSPCAFAGCGGNSHYTAKGRRGYCCAHYTRLLRHGDPAAGGLPHDAIDKWLRETLATPTESCVIWPFARLSNGYASFRLDGKSALVHRYICELVHGPAPSSKHEAAHSCGRAHDACVNPRHLRWATRTENESDKVAHGTTNRGERCGTAKLTREQALEIYQRAWSGTETQRAIAADYGIAKETVGDIKRGKRWQHDLRPLLGDVGAAVQLGAIAKLLGRGAPAPLVASAVGLPTQRVLEMASDAGTAT